MEKKLLKVCEEIFRDENEMKKFLSLGSLDEIYNYFSEKISDLTIEDFDEFVYIALESLVNNQNQVAKLDCDDLEDVSGGINFNKKPLTALLSLSLLFPLGLPASQAVFQPLNTTQTVVKTLSKKDDVPSNYSKVKAWIKSHPKLVVGVTAATVVVSGLVLWYRYNFNKNESDNNSIKDAHDDVRSSITVKNGNGVDLQRETTVVQSHGNNSVKQLSRTDDQSKSAEVIKRLDAISVGKSKFSDSVEGKINNIKVVRTGNDKYGKGIVDDALLNDLSYDGKRTAIVDAANEFALGGGGVDGFIFDAMGQDRAQAYIRKNLVPYKGNHRIQTGGAIIHSSFNISDKHENVPYVIQAVSPKIYGEDAFPSLYSAYYNAVKLGIESGCKRLLVPALGMAIFFHSTGEVAKKCADVAINAINDACKDMGDEDIEIIFTDYGSNPTRPPFYQRLSELGVEVIQ